jgi:hypothetical protein
MGLIELYRENSNVFLKSGIKVGSMVIGRGAKGKVVKLIKKGWRTEYKVDFGLCTLVLRENQIK